MEEYDSEMPDDSSSQYESEKESEKESDLNEAVSPTANL